MRIGDVQRQRRFPRRCTGQLQRPLHRRYDAPVGTDRPSGDAYGASASIGVSARRSAPLRPSRRWSSQRRRSADIGKIDMDRLGPYQPYRPIQSAMHEEVAGSRKHIGGSRHTRPRCGIVDPNGRVFTLPSSAPASSESPSKHDWQPTGHRLWFLTKVLQR